MAALGKGRAAAGEEEKSDAYEGGGGRLQRGVALPPTRAEEAGRRLGLRFWRRRGGCSLARGE